MFTDPYQKSYFFFAKKQTHNVFTVTLFWCYVIIKDKKFLYIYSFWPTTSFLRTNSSRIRIYHKRYSVLCIELTHRYLKALSIMTHPQDLQFSSCRLRMSNFCLVLLARPNEPRKTGRKIWRKNDSAVK